MKHSTHLPSHPHGRHWAKDLQFAVGVTVAIGGAAVLLAELIRLWA